MKVLDDIVCVDGVDSKLKGVSLCSCCSRTMGGPYSSETVTQAAL